MQLFTAEPFIFDVPPLFFVILFHFVMLLLESCRRVKETTREETGKESNGLQKTLPHQLLPSHNPHPSSLQR